MLALVGDQSSVEDYRLEFFFPKVAEFLKFKGIDVSAVEDQVMNWLNVLHTKGFGKKENPLTIIGVAIVKSVPEERSEETIPVIVQTLTSDFKVGLLEADFRKLLGEVNFKNLSPVEKLIVMGC